MLSKERTKVNPVTAIISVLLFCLMSQTSMAKSEPNADDARAVIQTTADAVINEVKNNFDELNADTNKLYQLVNKEIVPHVDFKRMSRWILGKHWRKASSAEKAQFIEEFKKLLAKTYASALLKFSNEEIVYLPNNEAVKNGKVVIRSEIRQEKGQRFDVQYRMHHKDESWKVYDISVGGVSLVSTYRNSFSKKIEQAGIKGLNAELHEKNKGIEL